MTAPRDILTQHRGETTFVCQLDMDQIPERRTRQDAIVDNRLKPKRDQGDTMKAK